MPRISYIAGDISRNEQNRADTLPARMPVNYLALTRGEMHLQLMREQAQILANYYGDPEMKKAVDMLGNALERGIHGMEAQHIGAASDLVRNVARSIDMARKDLRPASRYAVPTGRDPRVSGIGATVIPYADRYQACQEAAGGNLAQLLKCQTALEVEKILNDGLERCGQYLAYGFLPNANQMPQIASGKIRDQRVAIESVAQIGGFSTDLCAQWLNVGMMRNNVEVAKIQPLGWIPTNARLTLISDAGQQEIIAFLESKGARLLTPAQQGARLAEIVRKNQRGQGVGDPLSVGLAILSAISALLGGISEFLLQLRAKVVTALQAAKGFGTDGFGPQEGDFLTGANAVDSAKTDNTALYILGGAAAALALLK